jgi:hypothetical protein
MNRFQAVPGSRWRRMSSRSPWMSALEDVQPARRIVDLLCERHN